MNFSLNDDQRLLKDSLDKFVRQRYGDEHRRATIHQKQSLDPAIWAQFSDLGWLALPFSEADGGLGGSLVDTMIVMEAFGRGLIVEPYVASVVLGGGCLQRAQDSRQRELLQALMAGHLQLALAVDEYEQMHDLTEVSTHAAAVAGGYQLTGRKCCVYNGDRADQLIVLARTAGEAGSRHGLTAFLVAADALGVTRKPHRTVDGQRAAEIHFDRVSVGPEQIIGQLHDGHDLVAEVIARGILAMAAEALGVMHVLLYSTVDYTKTRQQFGVPIASFQALQHRMANMFMAYEQSYSLLLAATLKSQDKHADAAQAVHALKAQIGISGRLIAQEAIQLHGGMGMTDELAIGHYAKRLLAIDASFGNADAHLQAMLC